MVLPVTKPMVSTAGIVSPIDASTEPNRMLMERCRSLASAARVALSDSGDKINAAPENHPTRAAHGGPQCRDR